jgi:uncharacterized membrane protein YhaH (DUF805 family)
MGGGDGIERTFGASVAMCFSKYATFQGRAPRAEFWWFYLMQMIVNVVLTGLEASTGTGTFSIISGLFSLAILIPNLAVSARRLHDIGRSGWWLLLAFLPIIGWIILLVWDCTKGTSGANRFGPENGRLI